jgi:predicted ATPase/class 3 adenylate cyclase
MPDLPSGTVAFLFTDIEGSTRKWQQHPQAMATAVARHDAILRTAITEHGGVVFKTVGDAFCAAFATVLPAVEAALAGQRALRDEPWADIDALRVRMAIHAGDADERDDDYFGPAVNRVARLLSTGHGGQVLLSSAATDLVRDRLFDTVQLRDLGEHHLKDLSRSEHVYQLVVPDLPADFRPLASLENHLTNLPPQLTTLVGRDEEVATVCEFLGRANTRLVTLTGPGGVGKTRLSLQVAAESIDAYDDGVWFIPLEEATDESDIVAAIGAGLGVREAGNQSLMATLIEYLRSKKLLLILDNFEQIAHLGTLVSHLLRSAPRTQALITSRSRLGLQGEREFIVPPLDVPDRTAEAPVGELMRCSAVELFVERAQAVSGAFELTDANATAVTEICRQLDALPLAIELAAARVKILPPEALLARMERRLALLTGGRGDRPSRHQTLRATIAWSHDLLSPEEQTLFARQAVFAAGFTFDTAEDVCNPDGSIDLLTSLEALVDHSLLRQAEDESGEPRFSMLVTIREYAMEQLAARQDGDATRSQHVQWCLGLLERAEPALIGPDQQQWLEQLEREHDNLRAALTWASESGHETELCHLAGLMFPFWEKHGYFSEGRRWLEAARKTTTLVPPPIRSRVLYGLASLMLDQGDADQAEELHRESLALRRQLDNARDVAQSLAGLASATLRRGDLDQSAACLDESLNLFRQINDTWGMANALNGLASVAHEHHDYQQAEVLYDQSLKLFQKLGDQRNLAVTLNSMATVAHDRKDYARALEMYDRSLALTRALGDKRTWAMTLNNQAIAAHDQGDYARAADLYAESLALFRHLGDRRGIAYLLLGLGMVADDLGDYARATELYEESLDLFTKIGDTRGIPSALMGIAANSVNLGDPDRAGPLFLQALRHLQENEDDEGIAECLDGLARVLLSQGQTARAIKLYGATAALRNSDGMSLSPANQAEYVRLIATARATLGETAFTAAWTEGEVQSLAATVTEILGDLT